MHGNVICKNIIIPYSPCADEVRKYRIKKGGKRRNEKNLNLPSTFSVNSDVYISSVIYFFRECLATKSIGFLSFCGGFGN